jgi:hypothetical protein
MKNKQFSQDQNQTSSSISRPVTVADLNQNKTDFTPSADEVARRAYFTYVNQGSRPGHDVQHWLEAEEHLIAERDRSRIHGFHKHS